MALQDLKILQKGLNEAHWYDNEPFYIYGFLYSTVATGINADNTAKLFKFSQDMLNGGESLPGKILALFTELSINIKDELENNANLTSLFENKNVSSLDIRNLVELCEGLCAGFSHLQQKDIKSNNKINEFLHIATIGTELDPDAQAEWDDLESVVDSLSESLQEIFKSLN